MNVTLSSLARRKGVCCSAPKRISMQAVATTPHSNLEKEKEWLCVLRMCCCREWGHCFVNWRCVFVCCTCVAAEREVIVLWTDAVCVCVLHMCCCREWGLCFVNWRCVCVSHVLHMCCCREWGHCFVNWRCVCVSHVLLLLQRVRSLFCNLTLCVCCTCVAAESEVIVLWTDAVCVLHMCCCREWGHCFVIWRCVCCTCLAAENEVIVLQTDAVCELHMCCCREWGHCFLWTDAVCVLHMCCCREWGHCFVNWRCVCVCCACVSVESEVIVLWTDAVCVAHVLLQRVRSLLCELTLCVCVLHMCCCREWGHCELPCRQIPGPGSVFDCQHTRGGATQPTRVNAWCVDTAWQHNSNDTNQLDHTAYTCERMMCRHGMTVMTQTICTRQWTSVNAWCIDTAWQ